MFHQRPPTGPPAASGLLYLMLLLSPSTMRDDERFGHAQLIKEEQAANRMSGVRRRKRFMHCTVGALLFDWNLKKCLHRASL
jgi:hypothetical protein